MSSSLEKPIRSISPVLGLRSSYVQPSTVPWDPWEFDTKFFEKLSRWNDDHPETTFEQVFTNINTALQKAEPLFELIPDSPFPAHGLVKALAHLVILGSSIARAKSDVQEFALQIVNWVTEMTATFKKGRIDGGCFCWTATRNLKRQSVLIHEICVWAAARLHDSRWVHSTKGPSIPEEIREFKDRIAEARALLTDLSMVNLSQGIDKLLEGHNKLSLEIRKIRELQHRQLVKTSNGDESHGTSTAAGEDGIEAAGESKKNSNKPYVKLKQDVLTKNAGEVPPLRARRPPRTQPVYDATPNSNRVIEISGSRDRTPSGLPPQDTGCSGCCVI